MWLNRSKRAISRFKMGLTWRSCEICGDMEVKIHLRILGFVGQHGQCDREHGF
jgi:hypothetical protein